MSNKQFTVHNLEGTKKRIIQAQAKQEQKYI